MKLVMLIKPVRAALINDKVHREGYVLNPYDLYCLNKMVEIKKKCNIQITCLAMGSDDTKDVLTRCLASGCDRAILLNDKHFAGADTIATANTIASAIEKIGYDFIVTGEKSIDGGTGQTKYGIAELLKIRCVNNVTKIMYVGDRKIDLIRDNIDSLEKISIGTPCLISFNGYTINSPSINLLQLKMAKKKNIDIWAADDIGINPQLCGIAGSKTRVLSTYNSMNTRKSKVIEGDINSISERISRILII